LSERRRDPADGQWRLFSHPEPLREGAAECPFCPTTDRARPTLVPRASFELAVLDSPFPRLTPAARQPELRESDLYSVAPAAGASEVIVYSDRHDATLADLGADRIGALVHVWADRYSELGARPEVKYVLVFEDRLDPTDEHPHGEVYGFAVIPPRVRAHLEQAAAHLAEHGSCVVCDVVAREQSDGVRLVAQNESFLAFVPFAARLPCEVQVAAKRHAASLLDLTDPERAALARLLAELLHAYERLTDGPLSYVLALQQAPTDDGGWEPISHLRLELTPPSHVVGASELAAGAYVNESRPESSAARLRAALSS
jgi:UDPglucose--hexose-1-phosphate uridylyltransferase